MNSWIASEEANGGNLMFPPS